MKLVPPTVSFLFCAAAAVAQNPLPIQPAPAAVPAPAPQETPSERIAKLKQTLERLNAELQNIEKVEAAGGLPARVKAFLDQRRTDVAAINSYTPPPEPAPKTGARLLGDAEKQGLPVDVMFTVDGLPVSRAEFDAACAYLKSYPREESDEAIKQQAVLELVRIKAARAAFPDTVDSSRQKIEQAQKLLQEGKEFAVVAQQFSDCPTSQQGGDLGQFGRGERDYAITSTAFSLSPGQLSGIVESQLGYHLIKVTGVEKGESPGQDRVHASHVLVCYNPDPALQAEVRTRVQSGKVDLAFAADDDRRYAPEGFK